jgi:hypothetical protein
MVFGNAALMGVPWETIIKIYRKDLGQKKFNTLTEYANNFISFLNNNSTLIPEKAQNNYVYKNILEYFYIIRKDINNNFKNVIKKEGKINDTQIKEIASKTIKEHLAKLEKYKPLSLFPENIDSNIIDKYKEIIEKAEGIVFENLILEAEIKKELKTISAYLFSRNIFSNNYSGIAISGFGEKD